MNAAAHFLTIAFGLTVLDGFAIFRVKRGPPPHHNKVDNCTFDSLVGIANVVQLGEDGLL